MSSTPNSKTSRPASIIRWSGFVPIAVIVLGSTLYLHFFLDAHLKHWISKALTSLNGAKVEIRTLKTSLFNCTFEITGLDIANSDSPMKNRASIGRIYYKFLFRPLFSKKFVIREASVKGIQWGTPRTTSGVLSTIPEKPRGQGFMDSFMENLSKTAKQQVEKASIDQFTGLAQGNVESKIEKLGENSVSAKKIGAIHQQLDLMQAEWKRLLSGLPDSSTIDTLKSQAHDLGQERPQDLTGINDLLTQANNLKAKVDGNISSLKKTHSEISTQSTAFQKNLGTIDDAIQEDIASVRERMKIPSLNLKDLTPSLLGPKLSGIITRTIYWVDLSRKYLPKKSKDRTLRVEQKRGKGTDIHFAPVRSYPAFLLERALLESNVAQDGRAGNVTGSILDLNTHPPTYGKPTEFELKGEFPAARISGANVKISIDHVTERATENIHIQLGAFPIEEMVLSSNPNLALTIENASGKSTIDMTFGDNSVDAKFSAVVTGIRYRASSELAQIDTLLKRALGSLPALEIRATVSGPFDNITFEATSDLGRKLASVFTAEFEKELDKVNEKIKAAIETEFYFRKKDLFNRADTVKREALSPIDEKLAHLQSVSLIVNEIPERLNAEKKKIAKKVEDEAKAKARSHIQEETEKLKKTIKLPGF